MSEIHTPDRGPTLGDLEALDLRRVTDPGMPAPLRRALAKALSAAIDGEVRFDAGYRALYATDGSNYRMPPTGVVIPRSIDDLVKALAICHRFKAPVLARGGGTSLSGETCNAAVVIDTSKYLRQILSLDPLTRRARVQPGVVLDDLRRAANAHHLTFAPDPSTHKYCTLGGMLGNNSCGVHSVMAGRTSDNVHSLEVCTHDGLRMRVGATTDAELQAIVQAGGRRGALYAELRRIRDVYGPLIRARFPKIPRLVSGFGLDQLLPENGFQVARALVGTEGTCAMVLEATLDLVPWPRRRTLLILGYPDIFAAAEAVPALMTHGPIGLEAIDGVLARDMRTMHIHERYLDLFPDGDAWLLLELGGETRAEADDAARAVMAALKKQARPPSMKMYDAEPLEAEAWKARESGLGATARVQGQHDAWPGWEDSAVHPDRLAEYLRGLRKLYDAHGYHAALYGHFGQGCVHTRIDFELETAGGVARYHAFMEEASSLVVSLGGSLSGEHGDGQARAEFLEKMFGAELCEAFRAFKAAWDPHDLMNPGKVVTARGDAPYATTQNLRLGPRSRPAQPDTFFAYPDDGGSFARAVTRCVGVGKCRVEKPEEGRVMCPSYQVTREEADVTRGRAHALFEMLHGGIDDEGWRSKSVKASLDLCLSCKGCKTDCPMKVDMATYKAEFLAHHYAGRLRPRPAYAMGLIMVWARAAAWAPGLANALTQTPWIRRVLQRAAGLTPHREIPPFARRTLRQQVAPRVPRAGERAKVLLWADTFTNHFHPEIGLAAMEVLEAAGFDVTLSPKGLCCGRPLYDYGMLPTAKRQLRTILRRMAEPIDLGVPMVGLEPSCLAVFRDELRGLFPHDARAKRLAEQTFTLSEFLLRFAPHLPLPRHRGQRAVVQTHCHQHAVMGFHADRKMMDRLGLDARIIDGGCCGMAGSFGYEKGKFEIAQRCGEQGVLPEVRKAPPDALVLADGFSCRTQIVQGTGKRPQHLAEVIRDALPLHVRHAIAAARRRPRARRVAPATALTGALVAGAVGIWVWRRRYA